LTGELTPDAAKEIRYPRERGLAAGIGTGTGAFQPAGTAIVPGLKSPRNRAMDTSPKPLTEEDPGET
jgi:hypothetical protein